MLKVRSLTSLLALLIISSLGYCDEPVLFNYDGSTATVTKTSTKVRSGSKAKISLTHLDPFRYTYAVTFSSQNIFVTTAIPEALSKVIGSYTPTTSPEKLPVAGDPASDWAQATSALTRVLGRVALLSQYTDADQKFEHIIYNTDVSYTTKPGDSADAVKGEIEKVKARIRDRILQVSTSSFGDWLAASDGDASKAYPETKLTDYKDIIDVLQNRLVEGTQTWQAGNLMSISLLETNLKLAKLRIISTFDAYSKSVNRDDQAAITKLKADEAKQTQYLADADKARTALSNYRAVAYNTIRMLETIRDAKFADEKVFTAIGDITTATVTVTPTARYTAYRQTYSMGAAEAVPAASEKALLRNREAIEFVPGAVMTSLGRQSYFKEPQSMGDPILRLGPKDWADYSGAIFAHYIPSTFNLGDKMTLAYSLGTTTSTKPRLLLGPTLIFGRENRIYISAGVAFGEIGRLKGQHPGHPITGDPTTTDVFRWGTYFSIGFRIRL